MVIVSPTRDYKRNSIGMEKTHKESEFPTQINLSNCSDSARREVRAKRDTKAKREE